MKLDAKSSECMFLGYSPTSEAYRLWNYEKRRLITSRNIIFYEDSTLPVSVSEVPTEVALDTLFPDFTPSTPSLSQHVSVHKDVSLPAPRLLLRLTARTNHSGSLLTTPESGSISSSHAKPVLSPRSGRLTESSGSISSSHTVGH